MSYHRVFFHSSFLLALLFFVCSPQLAQAEIIDSSSVGFTLQHKVEVAVGAEKAFTSFTEEVGKWWSADHTFSGNAENLSFVLKPGEGLLEKWEGGNFVAHMEVVNVQPGKMLVLRGGLGPLQFMAVEGSMYVLFAESEGKTTVTLTYTVGGYHPKGVSHMAEAVDGVLGLQMRLFAEYVNG